MIALVPDCMYGGIWIKNGVIYLLKILSNGFTPRPLVGGECSCLERAMKSTVIKFKS